MPKQQYPYMKQVNLNRLTQEIRENPSILVALDHVDNPIIDQTIIWFKNILSIEEQAVLNDIVDSHIDKPLSEEVKVRDVKIVEEESPIKTGGHFQVGTLDIDAPDGEPGDIVEGSISWPFDVAILEGQIIATEEQAGDIINLSVAPDTVVGVITQSISPGETKIYVSSTVIENVWVGLYVDITNGSTTLDKLGRILKIEEDYIIVENATTQAHSPADPTYVRFTVAFVDDFRIAAAGRIVIGGGKIGASFIPANMPISVKYTNKSGKAKSFSLVLEYLY